MAVDVAGKRYVVVGMGKSGIGASRMLLNRGAHVIALDENQNAKSPFAPDAKFELRVGPLKDGFWDNAEAVVVSPGVPLSKPELQKARAAGVPVFGEIELVSRLMPVGAGPLFGITGTNGKSTTTALLGEIMSKHFKRCFVGGNLGTAFAEAYADPATPPFDAHVIELSSFQLEGIIDAQFLGGALLNITPDHLDRYADSKTYGEAKARIWKNTPKNGYAVINLDDDHVVELSKSVRVPVLGFTCDPRRTTPGKIGVASMYDVDSFLYEKFPFSVKNRALRGRHNLQNAMAATLMAAQAKVPFETIQKGLDSFPGLPHRMEFVRELSGVEWLNDSKATNVDSSLVALRALKGPVLLIAGGKGKGAPYEPLVQEARGKVKAVLTIGQDAPALETAFRQEFTVRSCGTLESAVKAAKELASNGDVVLLSPACASYDQFNNFEHRGETFKTLVRAL